VFSTVGAFYLPLPRHTSGTPCSRPLGLSTCLYLETPRVHRVLDRWGFLPASTSTHLGYTVFSTVAAFYLPLPRHTSGTPCSRPLGLSTCLYLDTPRVHRVLDRWGFLPASTSTQLPIFHIFVASYVSDFVNLCIICVYTCTSAIRPVTVAMFGILTYLFCYLYLLTMNVSTHFVPQSTCL